MGRELTNHKVSFTQFVVSCYLLVSFFQFFQKWSILFLRKIFGPGLGSPRGFYATADKRIFITAVMQHRACALLCVRQSCVVLTHVKAHSHQARLRPSTSVDGRRRAWCEWALTRTARARQSFIFTVADFVTVVRVLISLNSTLAVLTHRITHRTGPHQ